MSIGDNIRRWRKEKGWTQARLAQELQVSQQMVGQFENNKKPPKLETIEKIASALGITAVDLMGIEYWDRKYPNIGEEAKQFEVFRGFLQSAGYSMEIFQKGETCTIELAKDGNQAELTQLEFEELGNHAKEAVKEAIDGRFYKKVVEQQHKK